MILHALAQYYERKSGVEEGILPPPGFERKNIPAIIEINDQGTLVQVLVTDKDSSSSEYIVPQGVKRAVNIASNLLWDNVGYALGLNPKGKPERIVKQHQAFIERIKSLNEPAKSDKGIQALLCFLENFDAATLRETPHWELLQSNPNISFQLQSDNCLICERQNVIDTLRNNKGKNVQGSVCLVTGDDDEPERLHQAIKGVWGAQSSGANIVSFNLDSFTSYGKSQGLNAPVGKHASFTYTTALNHLLRKGSEQRFQVGPDSTVCWSAKPHDLESNLPTIFGTTPTVIRDDPDIYAKAIKAVFKSVCTGKGGSLTQEDETPFYVLGLAPNASRIAIRFWLTGTVREFSKRIKEHFDYLEIVRGENDPEYLRLFLLLVNTAVQGRTENIPPNLGGDTMRAILKGYPYPYTLLAAAIRRCRASQQVNYARAAIIKAYINKSQKKEVLKVALDKENTDTSYRLGRLFAALERIQEKAAEPNRLNTTIKDRYYGSASSNPGSVFPTLLKLSHHRLAELKKKEQKLNTYYEKLVGEIMNDIAEIPSSLSLPQQGKFTVGYYHQRQDFFVKHNTYEGGEKL